MFLYLIKLIEYKLFNIEHDTGQSIFMSIFIIVLNHNQVSTELTNLQSIIGFVFFMSSLFTTILDEK